MPLVLFLVRTMQLVTRMVLGCERGQERERGGSVCAKGIGVFGVDEGLDGVLLH